MSFLVQLITQLSWWVRKFPSTFALRLFCLNMLVLGEGSFWFRFRLFIQFLALWPMDEKVEKLDSRTEAEFKIALAKYYLRLKFFFLQRHILLHYHDYPNNFLPKGHVPTLPFLDLFSDWLLPVAIDKISLQLSFTYLFLKTKWVLNRPFFTKSYHKLHNDFLKPLTKLFVEIISGNCGTD